MQNRSNLMKFVFLALAGLAFVAGFFLKDNRPNRASESAQQTRLISLDQYIIPIDSAMIGYRQIEQLETDFDHVFALAVQGEAVLVAGDSEIRIYRGTDRGSTRIALPKPATALAIAPNGHIYVALRDRIAAFDAGGKQLSAWTILNDGAHITSLAASANEILAADAGNKIILRFDLSGRLINRIGERDVDAGQPGFVIPGPFFDVALADENMLWAVNPGLLALENYSLDGKMRSSWQKNSIDIDGFCGCCNPTQMALLPDGAFVTAEKGIPRVKIHEPTGALRTVVAGPKHFADGVVIADLAVDVQERILVLDPAAKAVRIFSKK